MTPNWQNRTLFHGDNLDFMRAMNSECIDLIATDPPFNKGRDFHATPDSLAAGASFQDRWSWEKDVHQDWVDQLKDDHPAIMEAIESAIHAHSDGMGAYMCFMAVRLLAMRRLLKPTGSMYLHCDPTASHYLKAVMDAIFGWRNFRSEIIWKRTSAHNDAKGLGQVCDHILYYAKSSNRVWNEITVAHDSQYVEKNYRHKDERGQYRHHEIIRTASMGERPNLSYEYKGYTPRWGWRMIQEKLESLDNDGRLVWSSSGRPYRKTYLKEGQPATNLWADIQPALGGQNVGWATQKPLALYERIIKASSNEGNIILDPFAGCATTCVAAERLNRQWVGIDIWEKAHEVVIKRLHDQVGLFGEVHYTRVLPVRTDEGDTAAPYLKVKQSIPEPPGRKMSRQEMYDILLSHQGTKCQGCDRKFDDPRYLELDHNTPRSDGGLNHISNRVLLCSPCNRAKSNQYTLSGLRRLNKKNGWMAK